MAPELKPHPARPQDALPRLVGIDELTQQLGMSVRNVRRLVSEQIPPYRLGRLYKALSADGNPSFATIITVAKSVGLKLHFEPAA